MRFFFITNSPELAPYAADRGVDRLFVDLEWNGKHERQGHLSTVISGHSFDDLALVRRAAPGVELMARLNPLHEGTSREVARALDCGSDVLMLPMYRSAADARAFCDAVGGRARVCLLLETVGAMESLAATAALEAVDEIHIGLNDLHLELRSRFMFEPLADGLVDGMAAILRGSGKPFGIGGVARVGEGLVPAELLLGEHARLGSTGAILSRTFHRDRKTVAELEREMDFAAEISRLRAAYADCLALSPAELDEIHEEVRRRVRAIVARSTASA